MPTLYRLKPAEKLEPNARLEVDGKSYDVIEFEPTSEKRYMVTIDIGGLPPKEAMMYLDRVRKQLVEFFPDGKTIFVPCRDGHPSAGIYELELQKDA